MPRIRIIFDAFARKDQLAQHFLKSAKARSLSVGEVARMSDADAYDMFKAMRFAENEGKPFCPRCGVDAIYEFKCRPVFKCKACDKRFTVTSGTTFHGRKMFIVDILQAILMFVNGVNGNASLRLARDLCCSYKTAVALTHKLRRAMGSMQHENGLTGDVDIDGIYIGGYIRPENLKKDRVVDGRKAYNTNRRSIVTVRERRPGGRSRSFVVKSEKASVPFILAATSPAARVHTDEGSAFSKFYLDFQDHLTVNHSHGLVIGGVHTNALEGQHARIRRGEIGVYHQLNGAHAQRYADEYSWRDDFRRVSNGQQFMILARRAAVLGRDEEFAGYWRKRPEGLLRFKSYQRRRRALKALTRKKRGLSAAPISWVEQTN